MMEPPLSPLRFRGNRSNPNHPAVLHLLRTYAAHLGAGLREAEAGDGGGADVHWDLPLPPGAGACLHFPGRPEAETETAWARTRDGFPVPARSLAVPGPSGRDASAPASGEARGILDACGDASLSESGGIVRADWDLLSSCADILFKRADFLPRHAGASREGRCRDLPDAALGLDREPWVDRWMFRLLERLPRFRAAVAALPSRARIWLTHDLDNLSKWRARSVAGQLARTPLQLARGRFDLLRRNYGEMLTRAFTGRDPYDLMDRIHALEGARKSASFLLANGRDHLFHRYELSRPRYRRVLADCLRRGKDVGLHGQVHVIADPAGIRAEVDKLAGLAGGPVALNRQHYLRWDAARTFACLAAAGIRVDSTLGYNDTPGFRTGTAWPYLWFDCGADRPTRLLEVPLILAEFQFYDPQAFDGAAVRKVMREYLETACRQGGVFTVLFHNQYFHEAEFPGHAAVYRDLIAWADARGLPDFDPLATHARYAEADVRG
ncbi:MAG TPA: polysaccharide deacetylase family protein [Fibrobacteria bacterium]|nr:polysaccharide deacetylase family protein [Fibrobacteria bacterium]